MIIIIDTNILVSAVISGRKPESVINWIINQPDYQWIVSEEILAEYQQVLNRRKFKLTDIQKEKWLNLIQNSTKLIDVSSEFDFPRDQKDAKFIACAISANADFVITGDRDFTKIKTLENTLIISVALFTELVIRDC